MSSYKKDRLIGIWKGMMSRCYDPKYASFRHYGRRGISVCLRWQNMETFVDDLLPSQDVDKSLDRIDNDGDYEPSNCRWATPQEQNLNRKRNIMPKKPDYPAKVIQLIEKHRNEIVKQAIVGFLSLGDRQKQMVRDHLVDGKNYADIARDNDISRERVRQIFEKIYKEIG